MPSEELPIILYQYSYSPYARRIQWYLHLRGIPYLQCKQPPVMPRPDVARLGIKYRRIPLLSIGRDVYLDTRLIIQKLEQLYPDRPQLGANSPERRAIERLLEIMTVDGGLFTRASQLMPADLPMVKDPKFRKDRLDFAGMQLGSPQAEAARPEALADVRAAFAMLEGTLLADGRAWALGTEGPTLADIEAVWPFHWLTTLPGALPPDQVSPAQFPRVFAWIARFHQATTAARKAAFAGSGGQPPAVSGEEAERLITGSAYNEPEGAVSAAEPVAAFEKLAKGAAVQVYPLDSGRNHKDVGRLVSLDAGEVVFEVPTAGGASVRVHAPRHGFRVRSAAGSKPSL